MGIVNVTPDSFFDGGRYADAESAYRHAMTLIGEGADMLDIGGESTRPGASPVTEEEEKRRVIAVIERVRAAADITISVDTAKSAVAHSALDAGADWINDISAGRFDPAMADCAARSGCPVILMHSRGVPASMQQDPSYGDVVAEVSEELIEAAGRFTAKGVRRENIVLDPGIGFAKRFEDNVALLRGLPALVSLGYPVCIGTSRKSMIGRITGREAADRLYGSLGSVASAFERGAVLFRVHDVLATGEMLRVLSTIANP
jgi:dihydropteroate synthase